MKDYADIDKETHGGYIKVIGSLATAARKFRIAGKFRMHLFGMYFSRFGAEWDSGDVAESDSLHHFELALSGRRQVIHGGTVYSIEPGTAWYLPCNAPVYRRCTESCEAIWFKFRCDFLPGLDPLLGWPERAPRCAGEFDVQRTREFFLSDGVADVNGLLQVRGQLLVWLARAVPELESLLGNAVEQHSPLLRVFDHIEKNLGNHLRVADLAKLQGCSKEAFYQLFIRACGVSPKDYINRRLNQEALALLLGTELKVKEIAGRLRFTDEYYFSRFFTKLNGCSPSEYRRRLGGAED